MNIVRFDSPRSMFDLNDGSARHIVTATFSSNQRVKEFWAILDLLRSKTRAAKITAEVWDYDDCNHLHCDLFKRDVEVGEVLVLMTQTVMENPCKLTCRAEDFPCQLGSTVDIGRHG